MPYRVLELLVASYLISLGNRCEGQVCPRTNSDPDWNCKRRECLPRRGCSNSKLDCLCDGDCGYSCVKKGLDCGNPLPTSLRNGRRTVSSQKFNGTATFKCNRGYRLTGSSVRTCRGKGRWDGSKPRCRKFCSDPGIPKYARRDKSIKKGGFRSSTKLHYHCLPKSQMQGRSTITCTKQGKWDVSPPRCVPGPGFVSSGLPCSTPKLPANTEVIRPEFYDMKSGGKFGDRLTLNCKPGYFRMRGSAIIFCNASGIWDSLLPLTCTPVSCGDPGTPTNGKKNGTYFQFGAKVTFTCDTCYKLVGESYRICLANKQWSDQQPTCQKSSKCRALPSLKDGQVKYTSTDCDAKAQYSCRRGYTLNGPKERRCGEYGDWSGKTPSCEAVSCGMPKHFNRVGLRHDHANFTYHSTINFQCEDSYTIRGPKTITCGLNGRWSSEVPKCFAPCIVENKSHLRAEKALYKHGETAKFYCDKEYQLHGVKNGHAVKCTDGAWATETAPYCVKRKDTQKAIDKFWKSIGR